MILFHGSNVEVISPHLVNRKRFLDFGSGFYMTSDLDQAIRWAIRKTELTKNGRPIVSVFKTDDEIWSGLSKEIFLEPDLEWLNCITENRKGIYKRDVCDVIIGPVADDQTINTIGIYFRGLITAEMAIELLLPYRLKDQYCFKTEKALSALHYLETRRIDQ